MNIFKTENKKRNLIILGVVCFLNIISGISYIIWERTQKNPQEGIKTVKEITQIEKEVLEAISKAKQRRNINNPKDKEKDFNIVHFLDNLGDDPESTRLIIEEIERNYPKYEEEIEKVLKQKVPYYLFESLLCLERELEEI